MTIEINTNTEGTRITITGDNKYVKIDGLYWKEEDAANYLIEYIKQHMIGRRDDGTHTSKSVKSGIA